MDYIPEVQSVLEADPDESEAAGMAECNLLLNSICRLRDKLYSCGLDSL